MLCSCCQTLEVIHFFFHGCDSLNFMNTDPQHVFPVGLELAIR